MAQRARITIPQRTDGVGEIDYGKPAAPDLAPSHVIAFRSVPWLKVICVR